MYMHSIVHRIEAFLDITWQDARGNSALMLAAAENRILHVKGILIMAVERGTLWQILDMRNEEGLTALEMAVRAGSDTCAMLITKFAREAQKSRVRDAFIMLSTGNLLMTKGSFMD
ncbi:unnamed protein product [Strongylus vulgaris]|uniref:Ankyrin repeat protein n=1 Tax=Strongylus vulgaris TaxID=40348 RepID=A0A3P7I9U4_STRVU|nr:unnamed protein product [Strongylus vulgaris]